MISYSGSTNFNLNFFNPYSLLLGITELKMLLNKVCKQQNRIKLYKLPVWYNPLSPICWSYAL